MKYTYVYWVKFSNISYFEDDLLELPWNLLNKREKKQIVCFHRWPCWRITALNENKSIYFSFC